jgi:hypothetical protein
LHSSFLVQHAKLRKEAVARRARPPKLRSRRWFGRRRRQRRRRGGGAAAARRRRRWLRRHAGVGAGGASAGASAAGAGASAPCAPAGSRIARVAMSHAGGGSDTCGVKRKDNPSDDRSTSTMPAPKQAKITADELQPKKLAPEPKQKKIAGWTNDVSWTNEEVPLTWSARGCNERWVREVVRSSALPPL